MTSNTDNEDKYDRPFVDIEPEPVHWRDMTWRDYLRIALGLLCFVLGILGLVLPILQGILFLIISAVLLAPYSRTVRRLLAWGQRRFPWVSLKAKGVLERWSRRWRRDG